MKQTRHKRLKASLLALVLVLGTMLGAGVVAAEQAEQTELGEPGSYPIVEEPVKMTMFRLSMPNVEDYETNDFTKYIEELTGVQWEFLTSALDTVDEQINLMMSSTELPDAFLFATPNVSKYGVGEQLLLPLDDLIEENMPNFMKYVEEQSPDLLDRIRQSDGKIYGLPSINDCYHCKYRNKMWINEKHLEEFGLDKPTTTEELKDVLKAYLEKNPNGVGISGSTDGWGQQFEDWITNAFILDPGSTSTTIPAKIVLSKDGKIESIATKDEYRESLKYMNDLFSEGLIYDGTFSQNNEQYRALMNQEGDPVLMAPYGTISDGYDVNTRPDSYASYRVLEPIKGPEGVQNATYFMYDGMAENKFVLSQDCKYPEVALRWADYFYTLEGYLSMQFGADEGEDWVLNPEGLEGLNGKPALYEVKNVYSSEPQNHDWQDVGLNFATDTIRLGSATKTDVDIAAAGGLELLLYQETQDKCEPYGQDENSDYRVCPVLKLTDEERKELEQTIVDCNKFLNESRTQFIRGDMDPNDDGAWQSYVDGFEAMGLNQIIEIYQAAYDRQFAAAE